jgi:hypothetical protein
MFKFKTVRQLDFLLATLFTFAIVWMCILFLNIKTNSNVEKETVAAIKSNQVQIIKNQQLILKAIKEHGDD